MKKFAILAVTGLAIGFLPCATLAEQLTATTKSEFSPDPSTLIPQEIKSRYAKAVWSLLPRRNGEDIYPEKALEAEVTGAAVVACTINTNGGMDQCRIMAENPIGYGFGIATAALYVKYGHVDPATVEGGIKPGDFWIFTYRYKLG